MKITSLAMPAASAIRASIVDEGIQVTDQSAIESHASYFCLPGAGDGPLGLIDFHRILSVQLVGSYSDDDHTEKNVVAISYLENHNLVTREFCIDSNKPDLLEYLTQQSFPLGKRRALVLINPHGGKGNAVREFEHNIKPIFEISKTHYDVMLTKHHCHATEIVKLLDLDKYDIIVCCSGDGIPHEVINGMYQRDDRVDAFNKLIVTQLPCGSGNAFSASCHKTVDPKTATVSALKSPVIRMDLMALTQESGLGVECTLSFLSQTYGVVADADLGTEFLRWMGSLRFEVGVVYKVLAGANYPCEISVKYLAKGANKVVDFFNSHRGTATGNTHLVDLLSFELRQVPVTEPVPETWEKVENSNTTGIFYTGKMPFIAKDTQFFPAALPNDGAMDLVTVNANIGKANSLKIMTAAESGKQIFDSNLQYSKITAYRLVPMKENFFSVDGESYLLKPTQCEILPGVLNIVSKNGTFENTILTDM